MRTGSSNARLTIFTPIASSPSIFKSSSFNLALSSATPPPGTIPSSIAAFVAFTASSIFNFKYFISVSVAAPTLITATPPANFAKRSCNFSRSNSLSVCSINFLICATRSFTSFSLPLPPTTVVWSLVEIILSARQKHLLF